MVNEIVLFRAADGWEVAVTKRVDMALRDARGMGVIPCLAALNMGSGNGGSASSSRASAAACENSR